MDGSTDVGRTKLSFVVTEGDGVFKRPEEFKDVKWESVC